MQPCEVFEIAEKGKTRMASAYYIANVRSKPLLVLLSVIDAQRIYP
jgi:hypothetical protein